ncbi:MAG: TIM barrel protein, partial [Candidatus Omnitrophota bacterium]
MNNNRLAISTTWNYSLHSNVESILSEIKSVGLDHIEIGYNFTVQRLKELKSLLRVMEIEVVSVHNFCPLPSRGGLNRFATDYYRLSSLDSKERKRAVDYTKKTIDTACLVSSRVVIIHAGTVEIKGDYTRALFQLYNQGKSNSQAYQEVKEKILAIRKDKRKRYLDSVVKSLQEIIAYAYSAGIKIGLETRYYPQEIPNIEEVEYLLSLFKDKGLLYWHDVGHAEVNQRLGITTHYDYLNRFADYMVGIHLHDLRGIDDHMAPFSGDFNWPLIATYMREHMIRVIEAHQPATPQQ